MSFLKICRLVVFVGLWGVHSLQAGPQTKIFPLDPSEALGLQKIPLRDVSPEVTDRMTSPILDFIRGAKRTLQGCVYKLDYKPIVSALVAAQQRGVSVTLFVESNPLQHEGSDQALTNIEMLKKAGIEVIEKLPLHDGAQLHAKFLMADNERLLLTTMNWDTESFLGTTGWRDVPARGDAPTRDAVVIMEDDSFVKEGIKWMEWVRGGEDPKLPPETVLNFGPLRSTRDYVTHHLMAAKKIVQLWQQSMQDDKMVDNLIELQKRGVSVSLVMTSDPFNAALKGRPDGNLPNLERLTKAGVQVRLTPSFVLPYIHMKGAVIDGKTILFTSSNFYEPSLDHGFEVSGVMEDPQMIQIFEDTFQKDMAAGTRFEELRTV